MCNRWRVDLLASWHRPPRRHHARHRARCGGDREGEDVSDSSEKLSNLAMMAMGETVNHLKAEIERLQRELIEQRQPDVIIRSAMLLAAFREENIGKVGDLRAAAMTMFGEEAVQRATDWFDPRKEKP